MQFIYNIATYLALGGIWLAQFFSSKLRTFVQGRQQTYRTLKTQIAPNDQVLWFHCASLGEFEQGVPIIKALRKEFPQHKILISFFSPSGYEIKKNTPLADVVVYLPLDTPHNAKKFIALAHPALSIFIKYEFWPNYLFQLQKNNIPMFLVSGLFRQEQLFFKSYGGFMRKALQTFHHIFVQNKASEELLHTIGIHEVTVSGDTRFDRVSQQIEQDNTVDCIQEFKGDSICVVCGSTWPEDELVLLPFINETAENVKFVIAPHQINKQKIDHFKQQLKRNAICYTDKDNSHVAKATVFIVDTIGLLTKIYSYADIAYVGGAMGTTGLHNILEPATFGVPIIIGKNYNNFPEAARLRSLAGLFSVSTSEEASQILSKLVSDDQFRHTTGMISGHFVNSNTGATRIVLDAIKELNL